MISSKKLSQLSKKWQEIGTIARRRIATIDKEIDPSCSIVAGKGNCIVYSSNGKRFEIPLTYLRTTVFEELLKLSHEEFGFASDGRITLPCDTAVMEYAMCLLRREASEDVERALSSIVMPRHHIGRMVRPPTGFPSCTLEHSTVFVRYFPSGAVVVQTDGCKTNHSVIKKKESRLPLKQGSSVDLHCTMDIL